MSRLDVLLLAATGYAAADFVRILLRLLLEMPWR